MNIEPIDVADVCTLSGAERPLRRAEFDDVYAAVTEMHRLTDRHLRLVLRGPADLADKVRELAARETECCSFFTFTVTSESGVASELGAMPGDVTFDIEVAEGYVGVLDTVALRASQAAST